jgi:hypothetical protein
MEDYLLIDLCKIVISYIDDFNDIVNLLKLNPIFNDLLKRTIDTREFKELSNAYILDCDIYATFYPYDEEDFKKYNNIFSKLRSINFYSNNYFVTDDFIKNKTNYKEPGSFPSSVFALNLGWRSKITNSGLIYLKQVHNLNLGGYSKITIDGLSQLKNLSVLNLGYKSEITNSDLKKLKHVYNMDLGYCSWITDDGLIHLSHVNILCLGDYSKVTNNGLKYLKNIKSLDLGRSSKITDDGLIHLSHIHTLFVGPENNTITESGLIHLKYIHTLYLESNPVITNKGLLRLINETNLNTLYLSCLNNTKITKKILKYFRRDSHDGVCRRKYVRIE